MSKSKTNKSVAASAPVPETASKKSKSASKNGGGTATANPASDKAAHLDAGSIKTTTGVDLTEKIRELVVLAKEQGHLTHDDINEVLPDSVVSPVDLDQIYAKLNSLEIDIVEQAEVDRVKAPEAEEEEEKGRLDILDDPVRMYLRQMGKVPLLTREQEVAICKRMESAENEQKKIIYGFGFTDKEHIALAEKLISEPPKERFDRVIVDSKVESREQHLKALRRLVKNTRELDRQVDEKYAAWQSAASAGSKTKLLNEFVKLDKKLQTAFPKFHYKQKVIEEMVMVTQNIHARIHSSLRTISEIEGQRKSEQQQSIIKSEKHKLQSLEEFSRMPCEEYLKAHKQLTACAARTDQARTEMAEANLR